MTSRERKLIANKKLKEEQDRCFQDEQDNALLLEEQQKEQQKGAQHQQGQAEQQIGVKHSSIDFMEVDDDL